MAKKSIDQWQFGDFQTPDDLARQVVHVLDAFHGIKPELVIEPTCGKGSFIRAALERFPEATVLGYDVNPYYIDRALSSINIADQSRSTIMQGDFFLLDWETILEDKKGYILILGNPPWVTSSELGLLNSKNLPGKTNFQGRRGIEAITGSGNFDISEWMFLQHIEWLSKREGSIALLCKYAVARKVMRRVRQNKKHRFFGHIYGIDAKRHFSAAVEACLFLLTTDKGNADCEVYDNLGSRSPSYVIGERDGYVVRDVDKYKRRRRLKGPDPAYLWRSGLKHDCSKVMELEPLDSGFRNGLGEYLEIEQDFVYPLLKSSDVGNKRVKSCRKAVIVPQKSVGEDTSIIRSMAPETWSYLESHAHLLNGRRSSIYRGNPPYSIFGVGDYTFKNWKIAISALYKKLNFCIVGPINGKPVVFDDTVNFLSFQSRKEAEFIFELLMSKSGLEFYESNIFWDEKRPITTDILRRLSLKAVAQEIGRLDEYRHFIKESALSGYGQLQLGLAEETKEYGTASCR